MELNFYTAQQVSAMTSLGVDWIWRQARLGKIPHHKLGGRYRWTEEDIADLKAATAVPVTGVKA
jgi:predicted DNA-binding transcriptional regulator AlpA